MYCAGTSEGVRKAWDERGRGRKSLPVDVKSIGVGTVSPVTTWGGKNQKVNLTGSDDFIRFIYDPDNNKFFWQRGVTHAELASADDNLNKNFDVLPRGWISPGESGKVDDPHLVYETAGSLFGTLPENNPQFQREYNTMQKNISTAYDNTPRLWFNGKKVREAEPVDHGLLWGR